MGNRAFIYSANERHNRRTLGVYLHWNGGPDSVVPLIKYCKLRGFRQFDNGGNGLARLVQVMGNFLGGSRSLGVEYARPEHVDTNHEPYRITPNWEIENLEYYKQHDSDYPTDEQIHDFMVELNKAQPQSEQMPDCFMFEEKPSLDSLKVGDKVLWFDDVWENYKEGTVRGKNTSGEWAIHRFKGYPKDWKTNVNCSLARLNFRLVK